MKDEENKFVECWKINCTPALEVYKEHINYFGTNIDIDKVDSWIKDQKRKTQFLLDAKKVWEKHFK